jgi:hypothetical protein
LVDAMHCILEIGIIRFNSIIFIVKATGLTVYASLGVWCDSDVKGR